MSDLSRYRRANIGVTIPDDTKLVSFGDYFVAKFPELNPIVASAIDKLFLSLNPTHLKRLSGEITSGVASIIGSYQYLVQHKDMREKEALAISETSSLTNYDSYVGSAAIKAVSLMKGISSVALDKGKKSVPFVYSDGAVSVSLGGKETLLSDVQEVCVQHFENKGKKIEIESDNILNRVAKKSFHDNELAYDRFLNDERKVISQVSLFDSASLFLNGKVNGKVGSVDEGPMTSDVQSYLTSSQMLKAMFVDSNGRNTSGAEIPNSSEFIQCGADPYRLGYNSILTQAILNEVNLSSDMKNIDSQAVFDSVMSDFALYKANCSKSDDVDSVLLPDIPKTILFNFSWIAETYKKSKNTKEVAKKFELDYELLFSSLPKYCGKGDYTYYLELRPNAKPILPKNFFRIPKVIDKLLGHYTILSMFSYGESLEGVVKRFFQYNRSSMSKIIIPVFSAYYRRYEFTMSAMGSSDFKDRWDEDETDAYVNNEVRETDGPKEYLKFGNDVLNRGKRKVVIKKINKKEKKEDDDIYDSDVSKNKQNKKNKNIDVFNEEGDTSSSSSQGKNPYIQLSKKGKVFDTKKGKVKPDFDSTDVFESNFDKSPASKYKQTSEYFRGLLSNEYPWLLDIPGACDFSQYSPDRLLIIIYYRFKYSDLNRELVALLLQDYSSALESIDASDDELLFKRYSRLVLGPELSKEVIKIYQEHYSSTWE